MRNLLLWIYVNDTLTYSTSMSEIGSLQVKDPDQNDFDIMHF